MVAKSSTPRELRTDRQHTDRFTLDMNQRGRRLSRRKQGTQRWGDFLTPNSKENLPTAMRPIQQMKVYQDKPHFLSHKENYSGQYLPSVITEKNNKKKPTTTNGQREPEQLYQAPIKRPMEKIGT
uniref:Uncharacterized protein n=1 Tax=Timema shepardi TaxID=629360 RepID=A0A7R9B8A7_TIMSH|nr:unnamed protein product [Timema shepardi]CAD7268110.1 unnamed protein product [Timema shepardi]